MLHLGEEWRRAVRSNTSVLNDNVKGRVKLVATAIVLRNGATLRGASVVRTVPALHTGALAFGYCYSPAHAMSRGAHWWNKGLVDTEVSGLTRTQGLRQRSSFH